jgi:putative membrane protein
MKIDLSTPQRQDLRGIVVIYFMTVLKQIRHNIYALIPLLNGNIRENYLHFVVIGFLVLLVLQLLYSYKSYLNFTFYIKDGHFYLKHGVFKISDIDIPFDRIQNININQNLLQQILNVVGVEIETAGKSDAEINIKALSRDDAETLKDLLLEQKKTQQAVDDSVESEKTSPTKSKAIFKLDISRLFKVGLSSNYLKGFGLIFAFTVTLYQYIRDILESFGKKDLENEYIDLPSSFEYIIGFVVFILLMSFIVTVASTVIKYFELKVYQLKHDFEVEYGLFKRINKVIKKEKTQVFEIVQNPISDFFKIKSLFVSQASSSEVTAKNKIGLVGVSDAEIRILFSSLFDLPYDQKFIKTSSNYRFWTRLLIRYFILASAIGIGVSFPFTPFVGILTGISLMLPFSFIAYKRYRKSSVEVNEDLIKINSGSIHTRQKYISIYKIQSVALLQNIFQQQNRHADLILHTASGSEKIQYIELDDVQKILNFLSYKVESTQLSWI